MPRFDNTQLKILNLKHSDLAHLSEDEQHAKIRRQWLELSFKNHPDKNPNDPKAHNRIIAINNAYAMLKDKKEYYTEEIVQYFKLKTIYLPETAFDLLLQENIEETLKDLRQAFSALRTEDTKLAFGSYYGDFINLALSIEKSQDKFNKRRATYLYNQSKETLKTELTRKWRELIIRLFAEEYLDDFQYRKALATGNLMPILAKRKLLSPIKCIVAIINSINLMICTLTLYCLKKVMLKIQSDFNNLFNSNQFNFIKALILALEILTFTIATLIPLYITPLLYFAGFSLPMLSNIFESIACPVNQIIRPLTARIGISPIPVVAIFSVVVLASIYAFPGIMAFANIITLSDIEVAIVLYDFYLMAMILINLYKIQPSLACFQFILTASAMLLVSFIPPTPLDIEQTTNLIIDLIYNLSVTVMLYTSNQFIKNPNVEIAKVIEILPLPKEPIPEDIRTATLLGCKTAAQSHRFFNTNKKADCINIEERTFWQQTASFFGGEPYTKQRAPTFHQESANEADIINDNSAINSNPLLSLAS